MLVFDRHLRTVQCNATHTVPDEKKDKLGASAEDQLFSDCAGISFAEARTLQREVSPLTILRVLDRLVSITRFSLDLTHMPSVATIVSAQQI